MTQHYSAALPIAHVLLRLLIILNWVFGAIILALLLWSFTLTAGQWASMFEAPPSSSVIVGLRAVAALGLVSIPLNYVILARLLALVETVRSSEPFVAANASRLQAIAWALLALQLLGMVIGGIGRVISTAADPIDFDAGFSINGWLAVLLTFILARVFAEGTRMRDDLDGTV